MLKAKLAGKDPYLTASQGLDTSPVQRLLSHRTRTLIPTKASLLQPEVEQPLHRLKRRHQHQCNCYNKSPRNLHTLKPGNCVRIQPLNPYAVWRLGQVVKPVDTRSYDVQVYSGTVLRRNWRHLRYVEGWIPSELTDIEVVDPNLPETVSPQVVPEIRADSNPGDRNSPITTRLGWKVVKLQHYKDFDPKQIYCGALAKDHRGSNHFFKIYYFFFIKKNVGIGVLLF